MGVWKGELLTRRPPASRHISRRGVSPHHATPQEKGPLPKGGGFPHDGFLHVFRAGLTYFGVIFAIGTALGIMRNLLLVPHLGILIGTVLEVPAMLMLSWLVCGAILKRAAVSARIRDRVVMGATALAFLWLSEALLSTALGAGAASFFTAFATPAGALGALAQIAFAAFPLLRLRTG